MSKKKYPPRYPKTAHGFRAQDLRALPRSAWLAKGWLRAVESMRLGARLGRGRVYAEMGQVTAISADGSHVEATVIGGRPEPYTVKMDFAVFPGGDGAFASSTGVMPLARIAAGDMPQVVAEAFSLKGAAMYPTLGVDHFWCSCPDWSRPCKHVAAVLCLLGDALVRDPALLLSLRGISIGAMGDLDSHPSSSCRPLPLWKGAERLVDALARIHRRTGDGGSRR